MLVANPDSLHVQMGWQVYIGWLGCPEKIGSWWSWLSQEIIHGIFIPACKKNHELDNVYSSEALKSQAQQSIQLNNPSQKSQVMIHWFAGDDGHYIIPQ